LSLPRFNLRREIGANEKRAASVAALPQNSSRGSRANPLQAEKTPAEAEIQLEAPQESGF
jgi:hypothetical protein